MRVCIPGAHGGIGGPASFVRKLSDGLRAHGGQVVPDPDDRPYDVVLVISCTRQLWWLRQCKRRGIPIVQRLDGFHWYHKAMPLTSPARWKGGPVNQLMRFIRDHLADYVVYQSHFTEDWWHMRYGLAPIPSTIIYNGVDTNVFRPSEEAAPEKDELSLISVEGNLGAHEQVLRTPVETWRRLCADGHRARLSLVGCVPEELRYLIPSDTRVAYLGTVPNASLPAHLNGATVFISAEINPPCPNSVIEALACGTPVVGFATGSLPELVTGDAGVCVDYGADPWKLEEPDIDGLTKAVEKVATDHARYSAGARRLALERYSLGRMVAAYVRVFQCAMDGAESL